LAFLPLSMPFAPMVAATPTEPISDLSPHIVSFPFLLFARARVCSPPQPFLQGRCKEEGKSAQGCIIMRTSQAVIIAVHDPAYSGGATFGKVNIEIARIADYFVESGF